MAVHTRVARALALGSTTLMLLMIVDADVRRFSLADPGMPGVNNAGNNREGLLELEGTS